ncbi:MAG: T9SS type A sorting domain-containing protein [Ferruginibacter sp.]
MKQNLSSLRRSVLTIFLVFPVVFCFAATYYISPGGNDATGNGSAGSPWKTLYKATTTVSIAGDIIHVNAGTYTETQQINLRTGVSIEGAGFTNTIIISTVSGQWSIFLSLDSPQDTNGAQSISGMTFDGQYVSEANNKTWWAISVHGRSNVLIHDMKIINFRDRGVVFDGNDATDPHSDPGHHATGNKFYNNTVLNSAAQNGNYGSGLLNIGGQLGMEIYGNTMIQDQRPKSLNGWPIKYWDEGWLRGVKIYNNTLTKAPYDGTYPGEGGNWDFCMEFFNIQGMQIYNNTIQGSIDMSYSIKGSYAYCAWIHHNTINHIPINVNFESGIILEFGTQSVLIENNVFNNVSSGVQFNTRGVANSGGNDPTNPPPQGGYSLLSNNTIRNNLFSNVYQGNTIGTGAGITVISEGTDDPQIQGLYIYNNTIVAKVGDVPFVGIDFSSMGAANASGTNINIRNNIVTGFKDSWLKGSNGSTHITGMVVTHNDAFGNANGNVPSWPGGNPITYTYNNNISADPKFVSATDFRLQPTSPCIDAGVNVGITYNGNAPDMGYAEFGFGGPLPIKLIEFNVKENNGVNLLQWTTATESNSSYFNIERSSNGQSYETIGRVNASGFSTTEVKYYFTDATPLKGINYYRLAMIDIAGKPEYSKIVSITNKDNQGIGITNIDLSSGTGTASIRFYSSQMQTANLSIIDINGRIVLNSGITLQKGTTTFTRGIPFLLNGIYYVKLFTKDETVVKNAISRN